MNSLKRLNPYINRYKVQLLLGVFFIILTNVFSVYSIKYVGKAVDLISDYLKSPSNNYALLLQQAGMIILFALISGVFKYFMRQTVIVSSRKIENDLKNDIYTHYQQLSLTFYRNNKIGDLMNRITEDVSAVRMYLGPGIMYSINLFFLLMIVLCFMLDVSTYLTICSLAPLPFLSIVIYKVSNTINQKSKEVQASQSGISSFVQDSFSGIRVIKSFNKEDKIINDYNESTLDYKQKSISLAKTEAFFFPLMLLIIGLSYILVLYVGGTEYMEGRISIGDIASFFMYINMLIWPFTSLGWVTSLKQRAKASMTRINEFIDAKSEIDESGTQEFHNGTIEFKDVSYTYPNTGIEALKKVSFKIEKGKTLAIMGKTGSGKSTIGMLLSRLIEPKSGKIKVNNIPINKFDLHSIREVCSVVPQDSFLFSETIYENILIGNSDATDEMIFEASKKACIYDSILGFDQGFQTKVGERGITLSGGQKQRISIARALVKNPELIIFDDSLSAVDTETEEQILKNIKHDIQKATSVIITHRISSAKNADYVLILENGRIIQEGTPKDLLKQEGWFLDLYRKQN
ncbi:MAG: ABC transporter ATP-binding protein [Flavobacteriales bacterium]|nr:ABC transporter ATP-binding protein [Flavobacteriales bacterium]